MVRCIRFRAESISRATSSGLSTVGSFRGHLGNEISSGRYGRRRVLTKKNRRAEERLWIVPGDGEPDHEVKDHVENDYDHDECFHVQLLMVHVYSYCTMDEHVVISALRLSIVACASDSVEKAISNPVDASYSCGSPDRCSEHDVAAPARLSLQVSGPFSIA